MNAGKVLDRAVTLCLRSWLPFALLIGVFAVPLSILDGADHATDRVLGDYFNWFVGTSGDAVARAGIDRAIAQDHDAVLWALLFFVVQTVFTALWLIAAYIFAAAFRDGKTMPLGAAYRVALGRWGSQIILTILGYALLGVTGIAFCIPAGILAVVLALTNVQGRLLGSLVLIAIVPVGIAMLVVQSLTIQLATFDVAVDGRSPIAALRSAIRTTLDRRYRRMMFGVGAAIVALQLFGLFLALIAIAIAKGFQVSPSLPLINAPIDIIASGLEVFIISVLSRELQARRSGCDLLERAQERSPDRVLARA